ncbi:hypothetical protein GF351_05720 [Candidatus Woesearchaeota archaeon]|nr:hypothetical protein [Candidatus Woesearchaeota archaeon]
MKLKESRPKMKKLKEMLADLLKKGVKDEIQINQHKITFQTSLEGFIRG